MKISTFFLQLKLMLWKNALLSLRNWKGSLIQIMAPVLFILLLFLCSLIVVNTNDPHPPSVSVGLIPKCTKFVAEDCISLVYATDNVSSFVGSFPNASFRILTPTQIESVISTVLKNNPSLTTQDVKRMDSGAEMEQFALDHPNVTQIGIVFYPAAVAKQFAGTNRLSAKNPVLPFAIYFNDTVYKDVPADDVFDRVEYHLERALADVLFPSPDTVLTSPKESDFPKIYRMARFDAVSYMGPMLFYCSIMFNFMFLLYQIVYEKELLLRQAMVTVGLSQVAYWLSVVLWNFLFVLLFTLMTMATGAAVQFAYFVKANFFVVFLNFFIFGIAMTPLAVMLSMLIKSTRTAINVGMGVFLFGILMMIIFSVPYIMQILYDPSTPAALHIILQFWPPFNFARVSGDIASNTPQTEFHSPGYAYTWSMLYKGTAVYGETWKIPPTVDSWGYQAIDFCIFTVASIILYNVLPSENGPFLNWISAKIALRRRNKAQTGKEIQLEGIDGMPVVEGQDEDVTREELLAKSPQCPSAVRICDLQKTYHAYGPWIKSKKDMRAVRGVGLTVNEGECFALLGHNGAGKTTTLGILNGLFPPTAGDAIVYGNSVLTHMNEIRSIIGVCPQHDVLWPELTAREHLRLYAQLKQVPSSAIESEIDARLTDVNLLNVGNNRALSYSGGMKRRLSVAISCIGSPKCIFLDEPTTGLDPMSRRQLWAAIQRLKQNRVILLTTHSMEEADALGDRVGIMAEGKLRCVGTPLHLKSKYGVGYVLSIASDESRAQDAKDYIFGHLPGIGILAETNGSIKFGVPTKRLDELSEFLAKLEEEMMRKVTPSPSASSLPLPCPINDWGISQTTLEEVFIKVGHLQI